MRKLGNAIIGIGLIIILVFGINTLGLLKSLPCFDATFAGGFHPDSSTVQYYQETCQNTIYEKLESVWFVINIIVIVLTPVFLIISIYYLKSLRKNRELKGGE